MTIWNLSRFEDIQERVVEDASLSSQPQVRPTTSTVSVPVKVAVAVAFAGVLAFPLFRGGMNRAVSLAPQSISVGTFTSVERPPLDSFFIKGGRYQNADDVRELLEKAAGSRLHPKHVPSDEDLIEVAYTNQQEDISVGVNRLSKQKISQVLKKTRTA